MPKKKTYDVWRKRIENLEQREGRAGVIKKETGRDMFGNIPLESSTKNAKVSGTSDYGLYYDSKGLLTTGIGHLVKDDETPENYYQMTKEQARELKNSDLQSHDRDADRLLRDKGIDPSKLGPYQKDAIKDFVYQVGKPKASRFRNSFGKLREAINENNPEKLKESVDEFGNSAWARQTPVRYKDFKARMLEPVQTEQYGPSDKELKQKKRSVPSRELSFEEKMAMYATMEPESKNIKEQFKAISNEIENPDQVDPTRLLAMNDMNGPLGSVGTPRKKKDEEAAKDIIASKAVPIAEDAAIKKAELAQQIVQQQPEKVKEVVNNLPVDDQTKSDVKQDIDAQVSGTTRDPLSSQFTDALTYFLPTIIGGIGGALLGGGSDSALAGMDAGQQAGEGYRKFQMDQQRLNMQQQADVDVASFVDAKGNPVRANLSTGLFTDLSGKQIDPKQVQRANIFKQTRSLEQEDKKLEGINTRFMTRFKLDEAKASQLSDKQVEQLRDYDNVLNSVDRISKIKDQVNTGVVEDAIGTALSVIDAAPAGFIELKSETSDSLAKYVKSLSGAQVSEQEAIRLGQIIPTSSDNDETFKRKLTVFKRIIRDNKQNFLSAIKSGQKLKVIQGLDEALAEVSSPAQKAPTTSVQTQLDLIKKIKARRGN